MLELSKTVFAQFVRSMTELMKLRSQVNISFAPHEHHCGPYPCRACAAAIWVDLVSCRLVNGRFAGQAGGTLPAALRSIAFEFAEAVHLIAKALQFSAAAEGRKINHECASDNIRSQALQQ